MDKPASYGDINWLEQPSYDKAVYGVRSRFYALHEHLAKMYGQRDDCQHICEESVRICEDFGLVVRGIDHPIDTEATRRIAFAKEHGDYLSD
jgi:hypothetical protein